MKEERIETKIGKDTLVGFFTRPDAKTFPVLLCMHGFSTNHLSSKVQYLNDELPKRGWGVFALDLRFHGESSGKIFDIEVDKNVQDVRAAYVYILEHIKGVESVSLFGSSYGGLLAIVQAIDVPTVPLLGLAAPVTDFVAQKGIVKNDKELKIWKKTGHTTYTKGTGEKIEIGYQFFESMIPYHRNLFSLTTKIQSNTFIVQGDKDEAVPMKLTKKFYSLLQCQKEFVIVPRADHRFSDTTQYQNMMKRFVDFYSGNL